LLLDFNEDGFKSPNNVCVALAPGKPVPEGIGVEFLHHLRCVCVCVCVCARVCDCTCV